MKEKHSFEMIRTPYPAMQHHNTEDQNPRLHGYGNLKIRMDMLLEGHIK
jgi:hypothetical protein